MPAPLPLIQDWFSAVAAEMRDEIAIAHGKRLVRYAELDDLSNRLANHLLADGGLAGQRVAILSVDPVQFIIAIIGVLKAGGIFVPLDNRNPPARLRAILDEITASRLLSDAALAEHARLLAPTVPVDSIEEAASGAAGHPDVRHDPDAPCYVFFSSGTTGRPKGIVGRLKAIDHFIRWEIHALGIGRGVRVSQLTAPGFDAILRDIFVPLCAGGTVCAPARREDMLDGGALVRWLETERINLLHCVPSLFFGLLAEPLEETHLPSLNHILLAGEVVPPNAVDRWFATFGERIKLVNLYGPSETTMVKFAHVIRDEDRRRVSIPIGLPIDGAQALILDSAGRPCETGTVGEIHIRTPYRSLGYLNRPDLTAAAFIRHPDASADDDVIYRTGDLGCRLPDGLYEFHGRKDDQVKIRGVRVELAEIEEALRHHPAVREAGATEESDSNGNKQVRAWVVTRTDAQPHEIRSFVAQTLPDEMMPSTITVVESLPRTISGKLDRAALGASASVGPDGSSPKDGPRSETERRLADIWSAVLGPVKIGVHDNFYSLGGHSLKVMSMMSRVRREFELDLQLRHFFAGPTVAAFAREIDTLRGERNASSVHQNSDVELGEL